MARAETISRICREILLWISAILLVVGGGFICFFICLFGPLAFPVASHLAFGMFSCFYLDFTSY